MEHDADRDIGIHEVAVRRGGVDSIGQLVVTRPERHEWVLQLTTDGQEWRGIGPDLFNALRELRRGLDVDGILLGLNGARPECAVSGMLADMGEGREAYVLTGKIALALGLLRDRGRRPKMVPTLGVAPLDEVSDVPTQDAHKRRWIR